VRPASWRHSIASDPKQLTGAATSGRRACIWREAWLGISAGPDSRLLDFVDNADVSLANALQIGAARPKLLTINRS
jgi:hypothetical protein